MKKRLGIIIMALCLMTAVSGCGGPSDPITYALVTGSGGLTGNKAAAMAWNGEQNFALAGGTSAGRYVASPQDKADLDAAIKTAVDAGASTVVCVGADLEQAGYTAQSRYGKVRFIMLGGQPRAADGGDASIGENTIAVTFDVSQIGYLAGYAAIRDGKRHLAFMAGTESEDAGNYERGFRKGAEDASSELGLTPGEVTVETVYAESDALSPLVMQKALDLYDAGCELIMAHGDAIQTAVIKAAESRGKQVATAGTDLRTVSDSVVMGSLYDSGQAVEAALLEAGQEDFAGGRVESYGAAEESVDLGIDYDKMAFFTEADYDQVYEGLAGGSRAIP